MKNMLSFNEIADYYRNNAETFRKLIHRIEVILCAVRDRDDNPVPLHYLRSRAKSPKSIFLKTKRYPIQHLNEITDCIGLRILCLFEQDIFEVHDFLIRFLTGLNETEVKDTLKSFPELRAKELSYLENLINAIVLEEIKIYNWDEGTDDIETVSAQFVNALENNFSTEEIEFVRGDKWEKKFKVLIFLFHQRQQKIEITIDKRPSGYKSIHYIARYNGFPIEIQLRTLLQDVWAELEHSVAYKTGFIHHHTEKSFQLLSKDLKTTDDLMTYLRKIQERERGADRYSAFEAGPSAWFNYDKDFIDRLFGKKGDKRKGYNEYARHMINCDDKNREEWLKQAKSLYNKLKKTLKGEKTHKVDAKNFCDMEGAFFLFFDGELNKVKQILEKQSERKEWTDNYVLSFRLGELNFTLGDNVTALMYYDKCEDLISGKRGKEDYMNEYRVKSHLARIYWSLGLKYIDTAIEKIEEAKGIYANHPEVFKRQRAATELGLANNICWYYLEKYVFSKTGEDFINAREGFEALCDLIKKHPKSVTAHHLDTAAWFCFNAYSRCCDPEIDDRKGKAQYSEWAVQYCQDMWEKVRIAPPTLRSTNLMIDHIKEINAIASAFEER